MTYRRNHILQCAKCGSRRIEADATVRWDATHGQWVVHAVADTGQCPHCGARGKIDDIARVLTIPVDREYRGCIIQPVLNSPDGIRWCARVPGNGYVRADTLAGVKRLIRNRLDPKGD